MLAAIASILISSHEEDSEDDGDRTVLDTLYTYVPPGISLLFAVLSIIASRPHLHIATASLVIGILNILTSAVWPFTVKVLDVQESTDGTDTGKFWLDVLRLFGLVVLAMVSVWSVYLIARLRNRLRANQHGLQLDDEADAANQTGGPAGGGEKGQTSLPPKPDAKTGMNFGKSYPSQHRVDYEI